MRGLVVYGSVYGTTRQYAEAIAQRFGFPCLPAGRAGRESVAACELLIFGGGLYAGGIDTGGWEADTYNVVLSGSTMGFNISSGRLVVREVLKKAGK